MLHKVIYIMGVSGSGKTTVGQQVALRTGYPFFDADNFHTKENVAKMNASIPLTDEDRWPWLENIHHFVAKKIADRTIILACSALKQVYRDHLSKGIEKNCHWVYLDGNFDTILKRLNSRKGHYMPPTLLQSQFDALEVPADALKIDINLPPDTIIDIIISSINN